jgi:hypothetical protein
MEVIRRWRNAQVEVLRQNAQLTQKGQQAYFDETIAKDFSSPEPASILFTFWNGGIMFGYGGLVHLNWVSRSAEVSFLIDTELTKGPIFETTFLEFVEFVADLGTTQLQLEWLTAEVFEISERRRVLDLLDGAGFVKVKTIEGGYRKGATLVNVIQLRKALLMTKGQ